MISKDKQYQTKSGKPVRIYATDGGGEYPVHGAIYDENTGTWSVEHWRINGGYNNNDYISLLDLKEVAAQHTVDVYLIEALDGNLRCSLKPFESIKDFGYKILAVKTVTFTMGDGL